jgi:hypothetical protein
MMESRDAIRFRFNKYSAGWVGDIPSEEAIALYTEPWSCNVTHMVCAITSEPIAVQWAVPTVSVSGVRRR